MNSEAAKNISLKIYHAILADNLDLAISTLRSLELQAQQEGMRKAAVIAAKNPVSPRKSNETEFGFYQRVKDCHASAILDKADELSAKDFCV
jgi:hypothetical protein